MFRWQSIKNIYKIFVIIAAVFWGLAFIGAEKAYSPVPYLDMWYGYLDFFIHVPNSDWGIWWSQHNEHRIFLSRLLFWMDLEWFQGASWFLLSVNYSLLVLVCLIFLNALKINCRNNVQFMGLFLIIWLSSWSQYENLTWAFQSQFILAQLLPLACFYFLNQTRNQETFRGSFYFSTLLGILSLGTMANGVLALPLMTCYAIVINLGIYRVIFLAVLSCCGLYAYFSDYQSPPHHGHLLVALIQQPLDMLKYILLYLGGPFYYILLKTKIAYKIAQIAGAGFIITSVYYSFKSLKKPSENSLNLAMLFFILYLGITAIGTAGGRLIFGVEQSLSSRYMTPALMAWASLFVVIAPKFISYVSFRWSVVWPPLLGMAICMLPLQLTALKDRSKENFGRNIAALALELQANDPKEISRVFQNIEYIDTVLSVSKIASEKNISIFGQALIKDVREKIGIPFSQTIENSDSCMGHIDSLDSINDYRFLKIEGWFYNKYSNTYPRSLWVIDRNNIVVGYVLVYNTKSDYVHYFEKNTFKMEFKGYILNEAQGEKVKLLDKQLNCTISVVLPVNYLRNVTKIETNLINVASSRILEANNWKGSDSQRSHFDGLKVYGSFIQADADTGSISLTLKRGDRLFYRSGPTGGNQFLTLNFDEISNTILPVSLEWKILEFSDKNLPESFIVTLNDKGRGWGEWSAIAVIGSESKE